MTTALTTKFQTTKYGLKHDPRGAHVVMPWQGRELLGTVIGLERDEVCGCIRLEVRHFCGDMWPIRPTVSAVDVLIRN